MARRERMDPGESVTDLTYILQRIHGRPSSFLHCDLASITVISLAFLPWMRGAGPLLQGPPEVW